MTTSFAFTGPKTMQQINYKCPSQQQGKRAYVSKNTVATMTIQLRDITNPRRRKGHPPPPPLASPQQEQEGKNRRVLKAEESK